MANYLLAARHDSVAPVLPELLAQATADQPGERVEISLAGGWHLTWIARDAAHDLLPGGGLFSGFAVDDERERICFAATGWGAQPPVLHSDDLPGCHVHVRWDAERLSLTADLYRSMSVFVTTVPGLVLISDSAYVLMSLRRRLGLPVTPDATVADSLRWVNSMSAQLLGSRTLVREIRYVPVGQRVHVPLTAGAQTSTVERRSVPELFGQHGHDYAAEVRQAAVRIGSLVHTVASLGPEHARLALSGGKDSRICLAAALLSPVARERARFTCTNTAEQHRRDFEVVSALSSEFAFPLGAREPTADRSTELWRVANPVALWYSDNSLSYFALKLQPYALRAKGKFAIAGYGSELYKGNYGLRPLTAVVESIARTQPMVAESVNELCEEVLQEVGVDPSDHLGAEWHYLVLRNALHGGRFVPVTKFGLRPLQQRNLVGLSKLHPAQYPEPMTGPTGIPDDLLALLSPALAARPFDRPAKDRSVEDVVERLRELGGPVSAAELTTYRILGSAKDVSVGPAAALLHLVDQDRLQGGLNRAVLGPLVDEAAAVIADSDLAATWTPLAEEARRDVRDITVPLGHARGGPGRALALAEVLR